MTRTLTDALKEIDIETKSVKVTGSDTPTTPDVETDSSGWDDEILLFIGKNVDTTRGKIDYNYGENTVGFATGSDVADRLCATWQIKHKIDRAITIRPHAHVISTGADNVAWKMRTRIHRNGQAAGSWSGWQLADTKMFNDAAGNLAVYIFPHVDISGCIESDMVDFQFCRDTDDSLDSYGNKAYLKQLDCHVKVRKPTGSIAEWGD